MGGNEDGAIVQIRQGFYQIANFMDARGVKAVGRFIQNEDRRTAQQRPGEAKPLFHTQGILLCEAISKFGQPHQLQGVLHGVLTQAQNPAYHIQVFPARQVGIERGGLNERANLPQDFQPVVGKLLPVNNEPALCGGGQPQEHLHGGGFARSIGAEKAVNTAPADVNRNIVDGGKIFVFLRQLLCGDDIVHRHISFLPLWYSINLTSTFSRPYFYLTFL